MIKEIKEFQKLQPGLQLYTAFKEDKEAEKKKKKLYQPGAIFRLLMFTLNMVLL